MGMAGLREGDFAGGSEDEGGRVGGLVRGVPAQAVLVGQGVVGVGDEDDVVGQVGLFGEELLRVLVEIGGRPGIDKQHLRMGGGEVAAVLHEVVHLLGAVRTLVAGKAAQEDERDLAVLLEGREGDRLAVGRVGGKGGRGVSHCRGGGERRQGQGERGEREEQLAKHVEFSRVWDVGGGGWMVRSGASVPMA